MTDPSSSAVGKTESKSLLFSAILAFGLFLIIIVSLWTFGIFNKDPYIEETLALDGSLKHGESLFRVNCVGCHGIKAQGLLGPDLQTVSKDMNDTKIINQIIKGKTPPMPSFELEPQAMADLLTYLDSLSE